MIRMISMIKMTRIIRMIRISMMIRMKKMMDVTRQFFAETYMKEVIMSNISCQNFIYRKYITCRILHLYLGAATYIEEVLISSISHKGTSHQTEGARVRQRDARIGQKEGVRIRQKAFSPGKGGSHETDAHFTQKKLTLD